jgi:hypothetical protein
MNRHLIETNYSPPTLIPFSRNEIDVVLENNIYFLYENGRQWMSYDSNSHTQALQLFSHYDIAKGHCICTGLGFGVRENWLLKKPGVSKITIIEKNKNIIEYNKIINPELMKNVEVINENASDYKGKCDTLLLDHYESQSPNYILNNVESCVKNIKSQIMWFWPLERYIFREKNNNLEAYKNLAMRHNLFSLPYIDKRKLDLYIKLFNLSNY